MRFFPKTVKKRKCAFQVILFYIFQYRFRMLPNCLNNNFSFRSLFTVVFLSPANNDRRITPNAIRTAAVPAMTVSMKRKAGFLFFIVSNTSFLPTGPG